MNNIKFWTFINGGPVKLKLAPGDVLRHSSGGATDEGWSRESNVWAYDGTVVSNEWCEDGVDCDGRMTRTGQSFFPAADAAKGSEMDGVTFPVWQHADYRQRDYQAEAAGY